MAGGIIFDFIFESPARLDSHTLLQGDLLRRSDALSEAVMQAHSYYAEAPDYTHFLVLTQSCDLVRRKGAAKSRYITICAVRPLSLAVQRELEKHVQPLMGFPIQVGDLESNILARQFLERVLNNSVDGIFFIPRGSAETVDEHLCAFLPLSIALRVDHYDVCLEAKVAQAKEIFGAKIGSLTSNLYSRIATPDLSEKHEKKAVDAYKKAFFEELGLKDVAWLSPYQRSELERRVAAAKALDGEELTQGEAESLLLKLPGEAEGIADRVTEVLIKRKLLIDDPDAARKAKNLLLNDPVFMRLARRT